MQLSALKRLLASPRIFHEGDSALRERALVVSRKLCASPEFEQLIYVMVRQMRAAPGVGLAAPQLGVGLRVIVMEDRAEYIAHLPQHDVAQMQREPLPLMVLVNPRIVGRSQEQTLFREACLSIPGYSAAVPRSLRCEVEAVKPEGSMLRLTLEGWPARIIQHEIDHLDGILYTDRMTPESLRAHNSPSCAETDES